MTRGELKVPVLPRDVAAAATALAVTRAVSASAGLVLILAIPGVVELLAGEGRPGDAVWPIGALAVMLVTVVLVARRPSSLALVGYIVVGTACVYVYQISLLGPDPSLYSESQHLLYKPAVALVLVGTASAFPITAIAWGLAGLVAGEITMMVVAFQLGLSPLAAAGPAIAFANYSAVFLALAIIQRTQSGRVPDVDRLIEETRRLEAQRTVDQRAVALIHDTVLNDLALVMHGPDTLDDRARERMRGDVAMLLGADWAEETGHTASRDLRGAEFRNRVMTVTSDYQWRGLTVNVSVDEEAPVGLAAPSATAALGAVRACLDNVLQHSGENAAELILGASGGRVTIMVVDSGVGFDRSAVPEDRLGLRESVMRRVESAGGDVRIWSAEGRGTSVLISLPLAPAGAGAPDSSGAPDDADASGAPDDADSSGAPDDAGRR